MGTNRVIAKQGAKTKIKLPDGTEVTLEVDCSKPTSQSGRPSGRTGTGTFVQVPEPLKHLIEQIPGPGLRVSDEAGIATIAVPAGESLDLSDPRLKVLLMLEGDVQIVIEGQA